MGPRLIRGGSHIDDRGRLKFANGFDMSAVRRFYTISNSKNAPRRGWIGHRRETKWLLPIRGTTRILIESMDGSAASAEFVLDAAQSDVLEIPGGNWFVIEQHDNAEVMVFSNSLVGEFENDDFRRPL